jgi:hypothetical protein
MPAMDMQQCIQNCMECHRSCTETMVHCLAKGGRHADASHIRLLADCADICQTSAEFMMRQSDLHAGICTVCADVCDHCAHDCDGLKDDEQMGVCAAMCRQCAQSCRDMARMAA